MQLARWASRLELLALCFPALAAAGSFSITPLRVQLGADERTAIVKVKNNGDQQVTVQVSSMRWSQDESGVDRYEPAADLVIFPKIVAIEAGDEKSVRIGWPGPTLPDREQAMRVYFEELPVAAPGKPAVRIALKVGVPVFLAPEQTSAGGRIDSVFLSNSAAAVRFRNDGNAHVLVKEISIVGEDASGATAFSRQQAGWYVLAGATRTFRSEIEPQECAKTRTARVRVELEETRPQARKPTLEARVEIHDPSCASVPVASHPAPKPLRGQR